MRKFKYLVSALAVLLAAFSCNKSQVQPVSPATLAQSLEFVFPGTEEAKIYVDETESSVYPMLVGNTVQLSYNITPDQSELTFPDVVFVSSDPSIVSVDNSGKVTAIAEGKATVSVKMATVNLSVTSTVLVKVSETLVPAESITIEDDATEVDETYGLPKIAVGEEMHLTAKIYPDEATFKTATWTSGDEALATVDPITGTVFGVAKGRVTITATAVDGSGVTADHDIFIDKTITPEGIALVDVPAGGYTCSISDGSIQVGFELAPSGATRSLMLWESSDPSVATIDDKGVVTLLKYGKVTITGTCPGTEAAPEGYAKSASLTVNIPAGFYREHFENKGNIHWAMSPDHTKQGGTEEYMTDSGTGESYMLFTPFLNASNVGRGDLKHDNGGKTYISPDYPLLTFRIDDVNDRTWDKSGTPTKYSRNINIDVSGNIDEGAGTKYSGNLGGGNNKWSSKLSCSDGSAILIYDLKSQGFGSSGILPEGSVCWMNTFQIKYADINKNGNPNVTQQDINYRMFWFHTFKDKDELNAYLQKWSEETGITYE